MGQKFSDGARTKLASGAASGDTTLTLLDGSAFPVADTGAFAISDAADWFKLVLAGPEGLEIIYVRTHGLGSATLSDVLRGQDGTTPIAFPAGTVVGLRPLASDAVTWSAKQNAEADKGLSQENFTTESKNKLDAIPAVEQLGNMKKSENLSGLADVAEARANLGLSDVVYKDAPQTLTNKTLTNLKADVVSFIQQYDNGSSGAAFTLDFSNGQKQYLTLNANATVTLAAPPGVGAYQLTLKQDATGGRTVTWAGGTILYVGSATAPAINTAANSFTVISLYYSGGGWLLAASKVNA